MMKVTRKIVIDSTPKNVWSIVSDIAKADTRISGIKKIEILEQAKGPSIVGLKWKETREWMGRDAVEVMWVTDAKELSHYETRAENHGSIYISRIELQSTATGTQLAMQFSAKPITFSAKILWVLTGWMAKKALCKIIDQDLADIKEAAEKTTIK